MLHVFYNKKFCYLEYNYNYVVLRLGKVWIMLGIF